MELLNDCFEISELRFTFVHHRFDDLPRESQDKIKTTRQRIDGLAKANENDEKDSEQRLVTSACISAAKIHLRAAGELIPHDSLTNVDDFGILSDTLRKTDIGHWRKIPFICLWMWVSNVVIVLNIWTNRYLWVVY
jgi:hypothetical protein